MINANQENANPTVIKLREFQLFLKREDSLNTYYDQEIENLQSSLETEYENYLYTNKLLLAFHMYSINNSGLSLKPTVFESLRSNTQNDEKILSQIKFNQNITDKYQNLILYFTNHLDNFSKSCIRLAKEKKELIDILTFSVIPGFFGFLSTKKELQLFIIFIKSVFKYDELIGCIFSRMIFAHPDFRFFMSKITSKLKVQPHTLTKEEIPNFTTDFCDCFQKYIEFCPNIVKTIMGFCKDEGLFIKESFLIPAFSFLRQYELIPYNSIIEIEIKNQLAKAILSKANILVKSIKEAVNLTSLSYICDISKEFPYTDSTYLFSYYDLLCINQMTDVTFSDGVHIDKISNLGFPEPSDFSIFVIKCNSHEDINNHNEPLPLSSIDELEKSLRTLLEQVNVIPLGTEGSTIEDVIYKQTLLFSEDKRLLLRLKVEDLTKCMQRVIDDGYSFNFEELIDLMKQKFEERGKERADEVSHLSSFRSKMISIKQLKRRLDTISKTSLHNLFQYQLIEKWAMEINPLSKIDDTIYQEQRNFAECFVIIVDNFNKWLTSKGYQKISENSIVYNFVMSSISLKDFQAHNPELVKRDQAFYTKIRDEKEQLLKNACEEWMEPLLNDPKSIEPLLNAINSYYSAKTPMEKVGFVNKLRLKADQVIRREGITEVGADQQVPVVLMIMIMSQPKHYISNVEYIKYFYDQIRDMCAIQAPQQDPFSISLMESFIVHVET